MADTDSPAVNLRKALKKLGPVQVNVVQALKALKVQANVGPFPDGHDPFPMRLAAERCGVIVESIVRLKEELIREYEALGGTWDRT